MPSCPSNIRSRRNGNTAYVGTSIALAFSIARAGAWELPAATCSTLHTVEVQAPPPVKAEVQPPKFTPAVARHAAEHHRGALGRPAGTERTERPGGTQEHPGITFTASEGNMGLGDLFTIRRFSSEQSITIDGVPDGGVSSRTDIFDLEQAEVYKGTGSMESGVSATRGSAASLRSSAYRA